MTELDLIQKIQSVSNKALDYIMFALSQFGAGALFIVVICATYWCISKRDGYKFLTVYIMGQLIVTVMKILIKRPRPYTHPSVRAILRESSGYSMPSGHSYTIANISAQLTLTMPMRAKNPKIMYRILLIAGAFATLAVAFTRVYLGQHYPSDTLVGIVIGIASALIFYRLFGLLKDKEDRLFYVILPLTVIGAAFAVGLNLSSDLTMVCGVYGAFSLGYFLEKKYIKYNEQSGKLYKQLLKLLLGGVLLLAVLGTEMLIKYVLQLQSRTQLTLNYFAYFITGILASLVVPMLFKKIKI